MITRILIVGYGNSGRRYHNIIKKYFSFIKLKIFSRKKKNDIFLKKISDIKKFKPQLSIICSPATKRVMIIKFLVKLNSHLLIEKPLASNYKEVKKIISFVKKKNLIIKIGYNLRFLNSLKSLNQMIKSDIIGRIYSVNIFAGQNLLEWRRKTNYKNTVSAQKKLGGGVLLELSHEIDYVLWIFGKFRKIFCNLGKISNLKINVEDICQILLFSIKKYTVNINLDFCRQDQIRKCHVVGEKGSLIWDGIKNKISFFNSHKKKWKNINFVKNSIKDTYLMELRAMLRLCNFKKKIKSDLVNLNEGSKIVKLIDYARYSSKYSRVVNIK